MKTYLEEIITILQRIDREEKVRIQAVAEKVAKVIKNDGIIYVFGCGHSHLPALDAFYRAGGLANVSPILDTDLMLFNGGAKSSRMEKMTGIAKEIFKRYTLTKKDMLIVISASGKNAVPVEMAKTAKESGIYTVGIASSEYIEKGGQLLQIADIGIDCKVVYGDAVLPVGNEKMGGLSTYASTYILNAVLIDGAKLANAQGVDVPIYRSGNIDGGKEYNLSLEERYYSRIKHL